MDKCLCLNEDNGHFYSRRRPEELTPEGIASLVDTYTEGTQVGQLLFCVNVQRALFDSAVWEPIFQGYDPDGPDDQELLRWLPEQQRRLEVVSEGRRQVHNIWLMAQQGLDHFSLWLERCRQRGVEGWLTVRMNDCHWVDRPEAHWHSTFWKQHPEYRIVTYRDPLGWHEYSLDFTHPEVREHYLRFFRELFERFDMDGIELDWMRFGHCLPYGWGRRSGGVITDFVRQVRELSKICTSRTGRPMRLGVRVPPEIESCLSLGYDVLEWMDQGLVEQITIGNFLSDHWLDFPIQTWKAAIGDRPVTLGVCLYLGITDPNTGDWMLDTPDVYRGSAGAALVKGADRIYLFNTCYYEHDEGSPQDEKLREILTTCGSLDTIAGRGRRHILTFRQTAAPGEADLRKIPVPLRRQSLNLWSRQDQIVLLQFHLGPTPRSPERAFLWLGFDTEALTGEAEQSGEVLHSAEVWVNGQACGPVSGLQPPQPATPVAERFLAWEIAPEALAAGENLVEYNAPEMAGNIVWAEIEIRPT
jgi:hypothetical protein